jgi:hypothetical protein
MGRDVRRPPATITTRLFADVAPSHLHFARVTMPDGRVAERVLTEGDRVWTLAQAATPAHGSSFADYVALGVEHIRTVTITWRSCSRWSCSPARSPKSRRS